MPKINLKILFITGELIIMTIEIFKQWTLSKLEENPKLFGGDNGNPAIIKAYLTESHKGTRVEDLTHEAISQSVGVSRIRNKLLEVYPEYDYREKYKPKHKRHPASDKVQEHSPSLFSIFE